MNKSKSTRIILIKGSASLLLEGIVCLFHWELFILNSCTHYLQYTAEYSPAPLKNLMTPCKLESSLKPQTLKDTLQTMRRYPKFKGITLLGQGEPLVS